MNVEQSALKWADQGWGDNPHPAGHHHQLHTSSLQGLHNSSIDGFAAVKAGVINLLARNLQLLGPLLGPTTRTIHNQQHHLQARLIVKGFHQRLEIAA